MAGSVTLKELVVKLGFKVDEDGWNKAQSRLTSLLGSLRDIGGAALTAALAVEKNVSRMSDKFFALSIAAQQAKTSVAAMQRMEYAGTQAGFAPGQMAGMAQNMRFAMRGNPYIKRYLERLGVNMSGTPEQQMQSLAAVLKAKFPEEKGQGWQQDRIAGMLGISPQELVQMQDQAGTLSRASKEEGKRQQDAATKAGMSVDQMVQSALQYHYDKGAAKETWEFGQDIRGAAAEPAADKAVTTLTDLNQSLNNLNATLQTVTQGVLEFAGALGGIKLFWKALGWLKGLKGAGGAAGEAVGEAGGAVGAGEAVAGAGIAGEAAGGAGIAGVGAAGAAGLSVPVVGWGVGIALGIAYAAKKSGLADKLQKWGEAHPLFGKGKGGSALDQPGAAGGLSLDGHWIEFKAMWTGGITVRLDRQDAGTSSLAPAPEATPVADTLKSAGRAVMHGVTAAYDFAKTAGHAVYGMSKRVLQAYEEGGIEGMIKSFEGYRANPYADAGGKGTIWYGHLIKPGENLQGKTGEGVFQQDYAKARGTVLSQTKGVKLNENQIEALSSLVFNIGGLKGRTILDDLKNHPERVQRDFLLYDKVRDKSGVFHENLGVRSRRQDEASLYGSPVHVQTTINVNGAGDPAAVAARVKQDQAKAYTDAMRNSKVRTG